MPKAHLDYLFLQDEVIENDDDEFDESVVAKISMTFLVMVETLCESVWAYATNAKDLHRAHGCRRRFTMTWS